jgi:flagellar M-ring protein FliF
MIDRLTGDRRILLGGVAIALVIAVASVAQWATKPALVPVASGVDLELSGKLADRLGEAGIVYELGRGGSEILVNEADLAPARVALARDGLATGARPGLELFDQQTWGWNDFTQRINYRRALEGELERTISAISGVQQASVHIAIGERSAFRREARPVTASVVLAMQGGATPSPEVVRGVAQLVSSSVDGLGADQVSVHDRTGRLWSDPAESSTFGLTTRQLRVQKEVESYLEQKAEAMVADVVGAGNVRVRVSAALNFDRIERTTQSVDPARQVISTEQKSEIIPGEEGGAASTTTANAYENSRSTETFSSAIGSVERLTVAVLVNSVRTAADGTVAAAPARSPQEVSQLEALVRGAVGLDSARGDGITVVSAAFERPPELEDAAAVEEPVNVGAMVERYQRPALNLVAMLAVIMVALLTLNTLRSPSTAVAGSLTAGATAAALAAGSPSGAAAPNAPSLPAGNTTSLAVASSRQAPRIEFPEADTQMRDRVVMTVEKDPDSAARLVKSWIKDA